jgi:hypothetical protein
LLAIKELPMRQILGPAIVTVSLVFAGCGPEPVESTSVDRVQSALTEQDVDFAPECAGVLTFVNNASFATLDLYLPSDVAQNIVGRRATSPIVSIADLSSIPLVGAARLEQIHGGAQDEGFVGASCVDILDELAYSADDDAAMVSLVNDISSTELHDILPYAWNGGANLLNLRPFTSARAIAGTSGISAVSFRNIRNAATLSRPLETLVDAVNATAGGNNGARMQRHFDWWTFLHTHGYYQFGGLTCFGIDAEDVPQGATIRPNLADANEVRAEVAGTVSYAGINNQIPPAVISAGLANLDARIAGRSFKGCYFSYADDPWSGNNVAFYVDVVNGFAVLTETFWVELPPRGGGPPSKKSTSSATGRAPGRGEGMSNPNRPPRRPEQPPEQPAREALRPSKKPRTSLSAGRAPKGEKPPTRARAGGAKSDEGASGQGDAVSITDEREIAYARVLAEIEALPLEETRHITVNVPAASMLALGALPKIRALREAMVTYLTFPPLEALDKLYDYAHAAAHAHACLVLQGDRETALRPLLAEASPLRERMLLSAELLANCGLLKAGTVAAIRRGTGRLDAAQDLAALATLFSSEWPSIESKVPVTRADVERAAELGKQLLDALGRRQQRTDGSAEPGELETQLAKAYELFRRAYGQCRRAVVYLRYDEGDADEIAPPLGQSRRRPRPPGPTTSVGS